MKKSLISLVKLVLCVVIIMFAEVYYFDFLALIGINVDKLESFTVQLLLLFLYVVMGFAVYTVYKDRIKGDFFRFKRKWFPNTLMSIMFFAGFTIGIWALNYVMNLLASSLDTYYVGLAFHNIFTSDVDIDFIFKSIIMVPFITTTVYIIGVGDLVSSKKKHIILSGLLAILVTGLNLIGENLHGDVLYIVLNVIPYFVIYAGLTYIYREN